MAGPDDRLASAIEAAQRWAIFDPDPLTRSTIDRLVDEAHPSLVSLFDGRLSFGTAGLRAAVGVGPNRMNALVVRQTTAALMAWLAGQGSHTPLVVIGYDGREHSKMFARHVAAAVLAFGGRVELGDTAVATPIVARRLLHARADAAVVITASHNPAGDNGYKLYLGDGLQLVSPADVEIAGRIEEMAAAWAQWGFDIDDQFGATASTSAVEEWEADHREAAVAALLTTDRSISVAYTPMHGVGGMPVVRAFRAAGFADPLIVEEQFEPDPTFSTVAFPNPEEPGALDLALTLAAEEGVDAVLANDPDADRLAVAVPDRSGESYATLSGDQLGILLADHVFRHTSGDRVVARSVVSSRLLDRLAVSHDVMSVVTLTGFKWVARPMITHAARSYVFGYEEAIGYCVGDHVRDKDGITAALVAAEMLSTLKADSKTAWDRLDELERRHGVYLTAPVTIRFADNPERPDQIVQELAEHTPARLHGIEVTQAGPVGLGDLPPTSGLHLVLADRSRIIVRPSGTEPKLKAYIEVIEPVTTVVEVARQTAQDRLTGLVTAVTEMLS